MVRPLSPRSPRDAPCGDAITPLPPGWETGSGYNAVYNCIRSVPQYLSSHAPLVTLNRKQELPLEGFPLL